MTQYVSRQAKVLPPATSNKAVRLMLPVALSLLVLFLLLGALGLQIDVRAANNILYVAPAPTGNDQGGSNTCQDRIAPCASVGHALGQAANDDLIKVAAGTYNEAGLSISKTVALQGGFTPSNWNTADPDTNQTIIDAQNNDRVIRVSGVSSATIEGFHLRNGRVLDDPQDIAEEESGGGILVRGSTVVIRRNHIHNNVTASDQGEGGGILVDANSQATIEFNQIYTNTATLGGGGISVISSSLATNIQFNQIFNNTTSDSFAFGGGIFNQRLGTLIQGNTIHHNMTPFRGGGIRSNTHNGIIQSNLLYRNQAGFGGGGIGFFSGINDVTLKLWNNTFVNNTVTNANGGGGISNFGGHVIISNTIAISNTSDGSADDVNNGDVMTATYSFIGAASGVTSVSNAIAGPANFVDPATDDYHLSPGSPLIEAGEPGSTVRVDVDAQARPFNSLVDVGADEVYSNSACFVRVNNGPVTDDLQAAVTAAGAGDQVKVAGTCTGTGSEVLMIADSIRVSGGYTTTNWNTPSTDSTTLDGQGARRVVVIADGTTPIVEGFRITGGSTTGDGGGIQIQGSATALIQNNFVYNNSATGNGGGIANANGGSTIQFNTLHNNSNGIYNSAGSPDIYNNIVVSSTVGTGIESAGGTPTVQYNDAFGNTGGDYSGFTPDATNLSLDPAFVNAGGGDLHLLVNSPVIGKGGLVGSPPGIDIDGDGRPQGMRNDMGADEATDFIEIDVSDNNPIDTDAGTVVTFTHTLANNSLISDTLSLSVSNSAGWAFSVQPSGPFGLDAGQSVNFSVVITVPGTAVPSDSSNTVITATSQASPSTNDVATDVINVNIIPNAEFTPNFVESYDSGTLITLTHTLTNTGNYTDTYLVTLSPPLGGWGTLPFTVTPYSVTLGQNVGIQIPVVISVPKTAPFNLQSIFNLIATRSGPGPNFSTVVTDTITALGTTGDRYVAPSGSDVDNNCSVSSQPCQSVGFAVEKVTVGDSVFVAIGIYSGSGILVNKTINLRGGYATGAYDEDSRDRDPALTVIDAGGQNRVMTVINSNATIESLTLQGGNFSGSGGGMLIQNSAPILDGLRLISNQGTQGGGAAIFNSTPRMRNLMVYSNTADSDGGGLYLSGSNIELLNLTIVSNTAPSEGGGVYIANGTVDINNTIVASNTAGVQGGGVFRAGGGGSLDYNNFFGNSAPVDADSNIANLGANSLAVEPGFDPLRLLTLLPDSPMVDVANPNTNNPIDFEGDLRPTDQGFDIGADELSGCLAKVESNGQIYGRIQQALDIAISGDRVLVSGICRGVEMRVLAGKPISQTAIITKELTLSGGWDSQFGSQNPLGAAIFDAEGMGRTLVISGAISPLIENINFQNGDATGLGGGPGGIDAGGVVYNFESDPTFIQISVEAGLAQVGGGVYNETGNPVFTKTETLNGPNQFISNTATLAGAGFYNRLGGPTLANSVIVFNSGTGINGGGFYNEAGQPNLTGLDTEISFNIADNGAGLYNEGGEPRLNSLAVFSNTANLSGGGIYNAGSFPFTATNVILHSNQAVIGHGGGFYNENGSPLLWHFTIYGNNATPGNGGGFYNASGNPTLGNTILANNAATNGGGLYVAGGSVSLTHNNVFNNTPDHANVAQGPNTLIDVDPAFEDPAIPANVDFALTPNSPLVDQALSLSFLSSDFVGTFRPSNQGYDIGARELGGCKAIINGNTSLIYGGVQQAVDDATDGDLVQVHGHCRGVHALDVSGQIFSQTVHLTKSITLQGGWNETFDAQGEITFLDAISRGHVIFIGQDASPTVEDFHIIGGLNGAIYNTSLVTATIHKNNIYSNTGTIGGAIHHAAGDLIVYQANRIFGNTATQGSVFYAASGSPRLQNNFIYNNVSDGLGTVYVTGGSPNIWHNTMVGNKAPQGSGVYRASGAPDVRGNIMGNLVITGTGTFLDSIDGTTGGGTVSFNNLYNNTDGNGNMPGTDIVTADPNLVVTVVDNLHTYRIDLGSAAFDAGDPALFGQLGIDFEDELRPSHQGMDLGADEIGGCFARINEDDSVIYGSHQYAVDQANADDIVDVAGTCYGVNNQGGTTQNLYVNKQLTLRGGWTATITTFLGRDGKTFLDPRNAGPGIRLTTNAGAGVVDRFRIINSLGGAIYNQGSSATVQNNLMYSNAALNGAGLYHESGNLNIWHNNFYQNTATGNGGGIYVENGGNVTVRNNIFYLNTAGAGQAVFVNGGTVDLDYNNAPDAEYANIGPGTNNVPGNPNFVSVTPDDDDFMKLDDFFSPLIDVGDPASPVSDDFEGQFRPSNQGPDIGADEVVDCAAQIVRTGQIYGHPQTAVDASQDNDTINVYGTCFILTGSQVLQVSGTTLTFLGAWADETFSNRDKLQFTTTFNATNNGRALVVGSGTVADFDGFTFINGNMLADNGGLVLNGGDLTLTDVSLFRGQALAGGGIYNTSQGTLRFVSSGISFGIATAGNGGGIHNAGGTLEVLAAGIFESQAILGGGIYNDGILTRLSNSAINNNLADEGGGLYTTQATEIINTYVFTNQTTSNGTGNGAGLYFDHGGRSLLFHETIRNNGSTGDGGGIYIANGSLLISNTLIVDNLAGSGASGIHNAGSGGVDVDYTDYFGNSGATISGNVVTGTNLLFVDPLFGLGGSLQPESPVIDQGDPDTHIDYDCCIHIPPYPLPERPQNEGFDLGIWEEWRLYLVDIFPDNNATVLPGSTITYTHIVSNVGNMPDRYNVTVDSTSLDWGNINSITPTMTITLAPGTGQVVTLTVTVPVSATAGAVDQTVVRATSKTISSTTDTAANNTTAATLYRWEIAPDNIGYALPGDTITYTHLLTNTGNVTDDARIKVNSDNASILLIDAFGQPTTQMTVTLAPFISTTLTVTLQIPSYLAGGIIDISKVSARSIGSEVANQADPAIPIFETSAANTTHISFTMGTRHVSLAGSDDPFADGRKTNNCVDQLLPCQTIAQAVSQAQAGDLVKIRGNEVFTEVVTHTVIYQAFEGPRPEDLSEVILLNKSLTVQGGYDSGWVTSLPFEQPTILQAPPGGRGIYVTGNISATIDGLEITGANPSYQSGNQGGAIFNDGADLTVSANMLHDNSASSGAALYITGTGTVTVYNNFIYRNNLTAAIHLENGQAQIDHNTFYSNYPNALDPGSDIFMADGTLTARNNIFMDIGNFSAVHVTAGTATLDTNIFDGATFPDTGVGTNTNVVASPVTFRNAGSGDLHLDSSSEPAVETGLTLSAIGEDIDRQIRPIGVTSDIGADEWFFEPGIIFVPNYTATTTAFNQLITYTHYLTNTGQVTDTFTLSGSSSLGWLQSFTPTQVTLAGGNTTAVVTVVVQTGPPGSGGLTEVAIITATSGISPTLFDTVIDQTTVQQTFNLSFTEDQTQTLSTPGLTLITYTHTITNLGNGSDTVTFSATNSQPGWGTILPPDITLGPVGSPTATAQLVFTVTLPAGTGNSNNTTVITAASVISPATSASVTDLTIVPIIPGLIIEPDNTATGQPGQPVTYLHTLTNTGNISDDFTLQVVSSQGWPISVSPATVTGLGSLQSIPVTVVLTIPNGILSDTLDVATVTATSGFSPTLQDSAVNTTTVGAAPLVIIAPDNSSVADPSTTVTYTHLITNAGNLTDTLIVTAGSSQGWPFSISDAAGVPAISQSIQLAAGQSAVVTISITIPASTGGLIDTTTVTATSSFSPTIFDTALDTTTITQTFGVDLEQSEAGQPNPPNALTITYTHIITNLGNGPDTFTFSAVDSQPGWSTTLPAPVTLTPTASASVVVTITIPVNNGGVTNVTTVTATSLNDVATTDFVTDTTTVPLQPGVIIAPDNSAGGLPGSILTFTHWVTNTGNGPAGFMLDFGSTQGFTVTLSATSTGILNQNQSVPVTLTVIIPASGPGSIAGVTDVITVSAYSNMGSMILASDTATNTVTVLPDPSLILEPDQTGQADPGTLITYTHILTNLGNITDTYTLTAGSSQGWVTTPTPASIQVSPGQAVTVTLQINIPTGTGGLSDTTIITATSTVSPTLSDIATDITTITQTFGVDLEQDENAQLTPPTASLITYTHIITNLGNGPDTFIFSATNSVAGWGTILPPTVTLIAGEAQTVTITVTVPANSGGQINTTIITATSTISPTNLDSVSDVTTVPVVRGVLLEPDQAQFGQPGQIVTYTHLLTNTGNVTDSYTLSFNSSQNWNVNIVPSSVTSLDGGTSTQIQVGIEVPLSSAIFTDVVDLTVITATSTISTAIQDTAVDTTTMVVGPNVIVEPDNSTSVLPNTDVVFSHVITNLSTSTDTFDITFGNSAGWTVTPSINQITLNGFASGSFTVTVTVPAGTEGQVSTTTITATSQTDNMVFETAVDVITVLDVSGLVSLEPDNQQQTDPGTLITYTHTITNNNTVTDTFDFTVVSSQGWATSPISSVTLGPGASDVITFNLTVPTLTGGLVDTTVVTATAQSLSAIFDTAVNTTTISQTHDLSIALVESGPITPTSTVITYTYIITNLGNGPEPILITGTSTQGWPITSPPNVSVPPGGSLPVVVTVTVPASSGGVTNVLTLTFTSANSPTVQVSDVVSMTIPLVRGLLFDPDNSQSASPGMTIIYTHTLTNAGNATDTFNLNLAQTLPWATLNLAQTTLSAGASAQIMVTVNVPASAADGTTHVVTVTATSNFSPTVAQDTVVDITTVDLAVVYLPLIFKSGPATPTPTPTPTATATPTPTAPPADGVDLVVVGIEINPAIPQSGQPAQVTVRVKNQGNRDVAFGNNFFIDFYVDPSSADFAFAGDLAWSVQGVNFTVGTELSFTGTLDFAQFGSGSHQIYAQIDTQNNVAEIDEGNNRVGPIPITVNRSAPGEAEPAPLLIDRNRDPRPTATPSQ